jgi:hydroxymethylpyrimidine pyrophosphatase-like HAD family hydrolase
MIIAVDFDGTCVTHEYPNVGKDIGAVETLRALVAKGHKIMLWTMRCNKELEDAVEWFEQNEIPLWGINENPTQNWSSSNKQYAHLYIDDTALGCPLKHDPWLCKNAYVDWEKVNSYLTSNGII